MAEILTQRLQLRRLCMADVEPILVMDTDPIVMRHMLNGAVRDGERYREHVQAAIRTPAYGDLGYWAVEWRDRPGFLGSVFLKELGGTEEIEIGYRFLKAHWGQGIATEAAQALLAHGFKEAGLERIVGLVMPENRASIRVLEKLGLQFEKMHLCRGVEAAYYSCSREAFATRSEGHSEHRDRR